MQTWRVDGIFSRSTTQTTREDGISRRWAMPIRTDGGTFRTSSMQTRRHDGIFSRWAMQTRTPDRISGRSAVRVSSSTCRSSAFDVMPCTSSVIICTSAGIFSTTRRRSSSGARIPCTVDGREIPSTGISGTSNVKICSVPGISSDVHGMMRNASVNVIPPSVLTMRFDELTLPFDVHMTIARFTMIASLFTIRRFDVLTITTDALEERPAVLRLQGKGFSTTSEVSL